MANEAAADSGRTIFDVRLRHRTSRAWLPLPLTILVWSALVYINSTVGSKLLTYLHLGIFVAGIPWALNFLYRGGGIRRVPVQLTVQNDELLLNGTRFATRSDIRGAHIAPGNGPCVRVRLRRRILPVEVEFDDEGACRQFLKALRLDPAQALSDFSVQSRFLPDQWPIAKWMFAAIPVFAVAEALLAYYGVVDGMRHVWMLVPIVMTILALVPGRLYVGTDGLVVAWLWSRRFIAYRDVSKLGTYEDTSSTFRTKSGVELTLKDKTSIRLGTEGIWAPSAADHTGVARQRIREAMEAMRADPHQAAAGSEMDGALSALESLRQDSRSVLAWVQSVRRLVHDTASGYRTPRTRAEALWALVRDTDLAPPRRLGAAVALSGTLDASDKSELKRVAEATALPKLRIALNAVADATSDDEMVAAIENMQTAEELAKPEQKVL